MTKRYQMMNNKKQERRGEKKRKENVNKTYSVHAGSHRNGNANTRVATSIDDSYCAHYTVVVLECISFLQSNTLMY